MKAIRFLLIFVLADCFLLLSCENKDTTAYLQRFLEFSESDLFGPDSLLTPEQIQSKYKLFEVFILNTEVRNDKVVFLMTEDEFLTEGLPKSYYDLIKRSIKETNYCIETLHPGASTQDEKDEFRKEILEGVRESLEDARREYLERKRTGDPRAYYESKKNS
jgi:hypothetical protein